MEIHNCVKVSSSFLALVFLIFSSRQVPCQSGAVETTFNITCDPKFNGTICHGDSLEAIVDEAKNKTISDLEICIKIHKLQLNKTLNFTNLSSLIIRGDGELGMTNLVFLQTHGSRAGIVISGMKGNKI